VTEATVDQQIDDATQQRKELTSKQNAAYNAAWSRLREKYRDEYDTFVDEEFEARGLERRKRATPEERAERIRTERMERATAALTKLLEENPELKDYAKKNRLL
jgi:hypothetical protein